jgi:hypothetical protein
VGGSSERGVGWGRATWMGDAGLGTRHAAQVVGLSVRTDARGVSLSKTKWRNSSFVAGFQ